MNNHPNKEVNGSISPNLITQEGTGGTLVPYKSNTETSVENTQHAVHECFFVLSGRGKGTIGSKADRIHLIHNVLMVDPEEYVPPHLTDDKSIRGWINSYSAFDKNPIKWKLPILAKAMCDFDSILSKCKENVATSNVSRPAAIVTFEEYMNAAREVACYSKMDRPRVRKGQIGKQKDGEIMQEKFRLKDLEGHEYDFEACASCNHRYVLPVGIEIQEILKINDDLRQSHTKATEKWHSLSSSRRGPKPKPIAHISQQLACMCSRMNCLSRIDGIGCLKCSRMCTNYSGVNSYARPMFDANLNCTCGVCACQCTALYYRDQTSKLAMQSQIEREQKLTGKKQSKLSAFLSFKSDLIDLSRSNMNELTRQQKYGFDVLSKSAIDLTKSVDMQDNVKRRLELQREVGELTPFVNGKSMSEMRKEKRQKRNVSIHKENCHLMLEDVAEENNIVSPSPTVVTQKNKRWYNNGLSEGGSVSSPSLSVNSLVEDINFKRKDELKKRLTRRLIDGTSPTNEKKKMLFNSIVQNKPGVDEIISISCEMAGDNMDDTVNMCKQMLMDNVL